MKNKVLPKIVFALLSSLVIAFWGSVCSGQIITSVAGNGTSGFAADGGFATGATIGEVNYVVTDLYGNVYFSDQQNNMVRKVDTLGILSTVAGNGFQGYAGDGGTASAAQLNCPMGLALDRLGNLFIADDSNHCIRKVNTSGVISTFGGTGTAGYSGDGHTATAANLFYPMALAIDTAGNLYIASELACYIRFINRSGIIHTLAGSTTCGYSGDGGAASDALLRGVAAITTDITGNIYFADNGNSRLRTISAGHTISTFAGTGISGYSGDGGAATLAQVMDIRGVNVNKNGQVYFADSSHRVRKVSSAGIITTYAGNGTGGFSGDGGSATLANLLPGGTAIDTTGNIYIAVAGRIRKISTCDSSLALPPITGPATVQAGTSITLINAIAGGRWYTTAPEIATVNRYGVVTGLAPGVDSIYYALSNTCRTTAVRAIVSVTATTCNIMTTVAGTGTRGYRGDGGAATAARLAAPAGVTTDDSGNVYFTDLNNHVVRKIDITGTITTIAGTGSAGFSGDGGPATAAQLFIPWGITVDRRGNIFVAEGGNNRIRKISASGIISTVAGSGAAGFSGDRGPATAAKLRFPIGVALDLAGNIYVSDVANNRVRKINTSGVITTVAGNGSGGFSGDGGPALSAKLSSPESVTFDRMGNMYISDEGNNRIRKVNNRGIITTFAGTGGADFGGDGGPATAAQLWGNDEIMIDKMGNMLVADVNNHRIRRIDTNGIITTLAGNGVAGYGGDSSVSIAGRLNHPVGLCISKKMVIYICDQSNNKVRKVNPGIPILGPMVGPREVCLHTTITLTDTTIGGTWLSSDTTIAPISSSGSVSGIAVGTNIISFLASNGCGTAIDADSFRVLSLTVPGRIIGSPDVCPGTTTILSATGASQPGTWSMQSSYATITDSGIVTGVFSGVDTAIYTVTNLCGPHYAKAAIQIHPIPPVGFINGPSVLCTGSRITLTNRVGGGTWSLSNANATITASGAVTGVAPGLDTVNYHVTNRWCQNDTSKVLTVSLPPYNHPIIGPDSMCSGTAITLTDSSYGGTWTTRRGIVAVSSGGAVTSLGIGTDTVYYTVSTICGAARVSAPVTVTQSVTPALSIFDALDSSCAMLPLTLQARVANGGPFPTILWWRNGILVDTGLYFTFPPDYGDRIECILHSDVQCRLLDSVNAHKVMHTSSPFTPDITIRASRDTLRFAGDIISFEATPTFCGSDPGFQWYRNGLAVNGATSNYYWLEAYSNDTVACVATSNLPCVTKIKDTSNLIVIHTERLGVSSATNGSQTLHLVPNPNQGKFRIVGDLEGRLTFGQIAMKDMFGRAVHDFSMTTGDDWVEMEIGNSLAAGIYIVIVPTKEGAQSLQLVLER